MTYAPDATFLALQEALAGRYSLERELGRGGMGIVYLAQDVRLDRPVALKLLPPAMAAQTTLRERFVREARTAARLSHPNIVPIHLVDEVDDFVFFVMAFVEGETLGRRVRERGPLHVRDALRILREVSWALAYAHGQGVVHRDVKPDNILIEAGSGRAMVTDFGIAHVGGAAGLTSAGEVLGTPEFMSPEQASGETVDGRSDIYALGVVGHYALSGALPLQGPDARSTLAKQLTQQPPALRSVAPEVPPALGEALDRCLVKEPGGRFQDGEELAAALGGILQERKEVPVAIRVFQDQVRDSAASIGAVMLLVLMMGAMVLALTSTGGAGVTEYLFMIGFSLLWGMLPVGMLALIARRLLRAGYGWDEMVRALREDVRERRRELASQTPDRDGPVDVWAPRVMWGGVVLGAAGIFGIPFPWFPVELIAPLFGVGYVMSLGGGIVAAVRHGLRKSVAGSRWLRFWESPAGRLVFGVAGIGVDREGSAEGGSYHPTEVALGMAAERLFRELPRDLRDSLGDVPGVVEKLESHAANIRAHLADLDGVATHVDGAGTATVSPSGAGGEGRPSVAAQLEASREAAEARLGEVVAALESIRLELLRLHAGSGSVENMTADLVAARALAGDVERLARARAEVEGLLGSPASTPPEPDTPVPA